MPSVEPPPSVENLRNWQELKAVLLHQQQSIDELNDRLNSYQHFHVLTHVNIGNLHERFRVTLQTLNRLSLTHERNTVAYELQLKEVLDQMTNCEAKINSMILTQEKIINVIEDISK